MHKWKTKRCCKCKIEKPIYEFKFDRSKPDNLSHRCSECKKKFTNKSELEKLREILPRSYSFNKAGGHKREEF